MGNKLLTFARSLPEHRMERKKLHLAEDIVYITLAAVLCGADTWEDISDFGKSKEDFLKRTLSLKNGIPSPDTFNRFSQGFHLLCSRAISLHGLKSFGARTKVWLPSMARQCGVHANKATSLQSTWWGLSQPLTDWCSAK